MEVDGKQRVAETAVLAGLAVDATGRVHHNLRHEHVYETSQYRSNNPIRSKGLKD